MKLAECGNRVILHAKLDTLRAIAQEKLTDMSYRRVSKAITRVKQVKKEEFVWSRYNELMMEMDTEFQKCRKRITKVDVDRIKEAVAAAVTEQRLRRRVYYQRVQKSHSWSDLKISVGISVTASVALKADIASAGAILPSRSYDPTGGDNSGLDGSVALEGDFTGLDFDTGFDQLGGDVNGIVAELAQTNAVGILVETIDQAATDAELASEAADLLDVADFAIEISGIVDIAAGGIPVSLIVKAIRFAWRMFS